MGEGLGQAQYYRFVGEQAQGPPFPACWRGTTGHRNQMGLGFAGEAGRGSGPRPFRQRREVLFHKPLARPLDGPRTRRYLLCNFFIAQPFIGFQQNAGSRHLSGRGLAGPDDAHEGFPLFRR